MMKKYMTLLIAASTLFAAQPALADQLDQYDAGEYVLLDINQNPTHISQRYYLNGSQWVMDGKMGGED